MIERISQFIIAFEYRLQGQGQTCNVHKSRNRFRASSAEHVQNLYLEIIAETSTHLSLMLLGLNDSFVWSANDFEKKLCPTNKILR
jgi:hypothetical protein